LKITFIIRRWLSREEFETLSLIADYTGRDRLGSKFVINPSKIMKSDLSFNEVIEILSDIGVRLGDVEKEYIRNLIRERDKIVLQWLGSMIIMKPNRFLGEVLDEIRDYVTYDKSKRLFIVKPLYFFQLKEKLQTLGFNVIDETNLKSEMKLPFKVSFKGSLRDYQSEALKKWIENKYRGVIALPTGSGKTVIALAAIGELNERTLIVVYTREQMFQWQDKIVEFLDIPSSYIGLYYGDEKRIAPITISTYQTAYRHIHVLSKHFTLLIVDECHHLPADKFKIIAENSFAPKRMGLSATVIREDGKHEELFPLMGGIVYYKTPEDLALKGYLAPYTIHQVYVRLTPEERREYRELVKLYRELTGGLQFNQVLEEAMKGNERAQEALKVHSKLRQIIAKAEMKKQAVKWIVEDELKRGSKILVFTQYVDQAKELGRILGAPVLTGDVETRERKRILNEFRSGRSRVLVVTTVGDEGLDIPDVNVGIIVTGTGSRRQFIQRLGRLLRPREGKVAKLYEIIVKGTLEEFQAQRRKRIEIDEYIDSEG